MLLAVILFEASPLLDMGFSWVRKAGGESTLDRVASIVDVEETSNAGRILMWKAASRYALHHPFGVGYANFVVTLSLTGQDMSFDQAASQENKLYQLPQRYVTAHSLYLQLLVELSILGLALFGLFWLLLFKKMWLYVRSASVAPESVFIATAAVVFIWFLAYSVFDVTWLNDKILLYTFVVLGLVRAVLVLNSRPNKDE
jgi:O-antigen ligase